MAHGAWAGRGRADATVAHRDILLGLSVDAGGLLFAVADMRINEIAHARQRVARASWPAGPISH